MQYSVPLTIIVIWLVILTIIAIKSYLLTSKLSKEVGSGSFIKMLGDVLKSTKDDKKEIEELKKELSKQHIDSRSHIQKVGLVKFNPFGEMGGSHSFSLSLLDAADSGFIITGLHARDKTRLYLKSVLKGKCELDLSGEEETALAEAIKSK